MIDFLARERHFAAHILPTWAALPKRLRGTFYVQPAILEELSEAGHDVVSAELMPTSGPLTFVASYWDLKFARARERLVVYSEHGAGQSYLRVGSGSYVGAIDRAGAVAVFVPGEHAAERHRRVHPTIPAYSIGCPKLDPFHRELPRSPADLPVVALSFHWQCRQAPETRGAHMHYRRAFKDLAKRFTVIGHAHPRALKHVRRYYEEARIEVVEDFDEVIARADVYCIDNSSTMYEWASLDRPVVVLNAPWYRRKVEHGLRFWSHADVGPMVSTPAKLIAGVERALEDPPEIAARRREIVSEIYYRCDGKAAQRAADHLTAIAKEWG